MAPEITIVCTVLATWQIVTAAYVAYYLDKIEERLAKLEATPQPEGPKK